MSTKETPKRLTPTPETLRALFSRSGNVCAFPGCTHPVVDENNLFIAQVCHIEAAEKGGERFNDQSDNKTRRHFDNLVIMCYRHHVQTNDVNKFPASVLQGIKKDHEMRFAEIPSTIETTNQFIDKVFNELQSIKEDTSEILIAGRIQANQMEQAISLLQNINATVTTESVTDFNKEIDQIMQNRGIGKQQAALLLFESFKARNWDKLNDLEKYRTLANTGICYLDLNKDEEAAKLFIEGLTYQPDNASALNYGSLGHIILKEIKDARLCIEKALKINPKIPGLYSSLIRLDRGERPMSEIIAFIPDDIRYNSEVALEISVAYALQKNYHEAIKWSQLSLDHADSQLFEFKAVLATNILESVYQPYDILTGQVSQPIKNKINYVIELLTEAWNEIKNTELRLTRGWLLINRGVAYKFLGEKEKAYEDMLEAVNLLPDFFNLQHLAVAALETGRTDKVTELVDQLETIATGSDIFGVKLFRMELLSRENKHDEVVSIVIALLKEDLEPRMRFYIDQLYIDILLAQGDHKAAFERNEALISEFPNFLALYINRAKFHLQQGKTDEVKTDLLTAYAMVAIDSEPDKLHQLAGALIKAGLFDEGIILLERLTNTSIYSKSTEQLLNVYYQAGEYDKLLKACRNLINIYGPIAYVAELQSFVYESINDFENAIKTCEDYLIIYPDDQYVLSRLIFINERKGNRDEVKKRLAQLTHIDSKLPMMVQYKIALLFHHTGSPKRCFEVAYETRRQFYEQAEAHQSFVQMSMNIEQQTKHPTDPQKVEIDTAVTLSINETPITYIIENRKEPLASRGELNANDSLTKLLMNAATGDEVLVKDGIETAIILNIRNKFNYAFLESFELLTTKFAHISSFRKFKVGNSGDLMEDFKEMFKGLDRMEQQNNEIEELYRKGILSIGSIAELKNVNPIHVWTNMVSDPDSGLLTTGTIHELIFGNKALDAHVPILLDLVAILTLAQLEGLDLLTLISNSKYVSGSILEVFNQVITDLEKNRNTGTLTLGKTKGNYLRQQLSPEQINYNITYFKNILTWINANCTLLPVQAALNMNAKNKQQLDDVLGETFVDAILTAQEKKCLLFADEVIVRQIAMNDHRVHGYSTAMFLLYLHQRQLINDDRFDSLWLKLFGLNYKVLPADDHLLYLSAIETKFLLKYPFTNVLTGLLSEYNQGDLCIKHAAGFLHRVYNFQVPFIISSNFDNLKNSILIRCLDLLTLRYQRQFIESHLLDEIEKSFRGYPVTTNQVKQVVIKYFKS